MSNAGRATLGCRQAVRHQTLTLAFVGSNPAIPAKGCGVQHLSPITNDPLAQPAEQLPFKQWVRSSNLRRVTKKHQYPNGYWCFLLFRKEIRKLKCKAPGEPCLPPAGRRQHNTCRPYPDGKANELRRVTKNSTTQRGGGVFAVGDSKNQMQQSGGLLPAG